MTVLDDLVASLQRLPTIGPRTARRLALHLLQKDRRGAESLAGSLTEALAHLVPCERCRQLAEDRLCSVCTDPDRDQSLVCVVETLDDLLRIEQSGMFSGRYFVLNGALSPVDGLGPEELGIPLLLAQAQDRVREVVLALGTGVEGEATAHYLGEHLPDTVTVTRLAQGVPLGGNLARLDPATLGQALEARVAAGRPGK